LNAHFICFITDTQYSLNNTTTTTKKIIIINSFYLNLYCMFCNQPTKEAGCISLKHMQVLKVESEITVLYKIIITVFFFFIIKIHLSLSLALSLSTSLYFLCVLNKHHCSHSTAPWRVQRRGRHCSLAGPPPPPRVEPPVHLPPLCHTLECPSPFSPYNVV